MSAIRFNCKSSCLRLYLFLLICVCLWYASFLYKLLEDAEVSDNTINEDYSSIDINKPHLVIGILSAGTGHARRQSVRNTWIATIRTIKHQLPFRITYRFLLDEPNECSNEESNIHRDIVYLNVTNHGYAYKFGEKLHVWLKYVMDTFPDVSLGIKMDDDAYLCIPQILYRLSEIRSPTLWYGYKHEKHNNPNLTIKQSIDEMFVVLGRDLIRRIANREYCGKFKCSSKNQLSETNYGGTSLAQWLSIYKDVDIYADNKRMIHFGRRQLAFLKQYISSSICRNYVLFHKALPDVMIRLHHLYFHKNYLVQKPSFNISAEYGLDYFHDFATTGSFFTGNIVRYTIPLILHNTTKLVGTLSSCHSNMTCDNWAVVTTINHPSKAVKNLLKDINWCMVVVADLKTPYKSEYLEFLTDESNRKRLIFLSLDEQSSLFPVLSESIPYNSIGRKNIGLMYAIHRRAKVIWDFDDDNDGIIDLNDFGPETPASSYVKICTGFRNRLINPYPYFGVQASLSWPRGFPLQYIKEHKTIPKICKNNEIIKVGVIQSLANGQPDVDAIYRLTRTVPFNFSSSKSHHGLIIPKNSFSPFNAQATLWMPPAFQYLALPISVNGRVSDIWRSYIAQYFMHKRDIKLSFVRPFVYQERNTHTLIRDLNGEKDLYEKSQQLIDFLSRPYVRTYKTITALYENLYKRKYIESSDLRFIKAWETTLSFVRRM